MVFNLLDVVDSGVVSNKVSESTTPGATVSGISADNKYELLCIFILIIIIALLLVVIYAIASKNKELKQQNKNETTKKITPEENNLLYQYQKLTKQEKQVIEDTIKTFNNSRKE